MLSGVALWAYAPDLPREVLIARYGQPHSSFIEVADAQAHVRDEGKADAMPLLLIHGSLGSLHMWDGWVAELQDRYRLISVDLPGHGLTGDWPRGEFYDRGLCRLHRGAGRHAASRPLRRRRPFDGRRRGLDFRGDPAGAGQPV